MSSDYTVYMLELELTSGEKKVHLGYGQGLIPEAVIDELNLSDMEHLQGTVLYRSWLKGAKVTKIFTLHILQTEAEAVKIEKKIRAQKSLKRTLNVLLKQQKVQHYYGEDSPQIDTLNRELYNGTVCRNPFNKHVNGAADSLSA